jgi:hypothetical protein
VFKIRNGQSAGLKTARAAQPVGQVAAVIDGASVKRVRESQVDHSAATRIAAIGGGRSAPARRATQSAQDDWKEF